jgi:hypothetical protein
MGLLNNDLNIFYSGASGGFYLLHYLLLFRQHWCALEYPGALQHILDQGLQTQKDQLRLSATAYADCAGSDWPSYTEYNQLYPDIAEPAKSELETLHTTWSHNVDYIEQGFDTKLKLILDQQWNIPTTSAWKLNETWPANSATLAAVAPPRPYKIFFTCITPSTSTEFLDYPGKKILIYTDLRSQLLLAGAKNAGWFANGKQLSTTQVKNFMRQAFVFRGRQIYHRLQPYVAAADHAICLQDLVADPESVLGVPVSDQHRQFTQHWRNCHSPTLRQKTRLDP